MEEPYVRVVSEAKDFDQARLLFLDYAGAYGLDHDYLNFDLELNTLEHLYVSPTGRILLCFEEEEKEAWGMAALRFRDRGVFELKRVFLREQERDIANTRWLVEQAIDNARQMNANGLVIHLIPEMAETVVACTALGFEESEAYQPGPEGSIYMYKDF